MEIVRDHEEATRVYSLLLVPRRTGDSAGIKQFSVFLHIVPDSSGSVF